MSDSENITTNSSEVLDLKDSISEKDAANMSVFEEMAKVGIFYGRKKSTTNPKMLNFIQTIRNGITIFDISKTLESIETARGFLKEVVQKGGQLLFVGTQASAKETIKNLAEKLGFPYVTERWLGGTLTNFATLSKRINRYLQLQADRATGKLEKYTKKERLDFDREIERMKKLFGGLDKMTKSPEAIIIVDSKVHVTAVREATRLKVPIIAIVNSDGDPDAIQYPIAANASSKTSIVWILAKLELAIEEGRKNAVLDVKKSETSDIKK